MPDSDEDVVEGLAEFGVGKGTGFDSRAQIAARAVLEEEIVVLGIFEEFVKADDTGVM